MVTDRTTHDRGQLILVGAVAIAFILLGIVVVFNSVLYTQAIASSDTVESSADASATELELERGSARVTRSVNRDTADDSNLEDRLLHEEDGTLWAYTDRYVKTKAETRPTVVDVNESRANVTGWGRLVHQQSDGEFTPSDDNDDGDDDDEWYVFGNESDPSPERELGRLTLTIDVGSLDDGDDDDEDDGLVVTLEEMSGDNEITFESDDDEENLSVDFDGEDSDAACEIEPRADNKVQVDLVAGTAWAETVGPDCDEALDLTNGLGGNYTALTFESDDGARGTYEVVVSAANESDAEDTDGDSRPAIWSFEYEYHYDSAQVSYTRLIEVDVYGGGAE